MKIVLTGSIGRINQTLVPKLTHAGHEVTVISHQAIRSSLIKVFAQPLPLVDLMTKRF